MSPRAGTQLSTTFTNVPEVRRHVRSHCNIAGPSPNHWSINITAKQNIPKSSMNESCWRTLKDEDTRDCLNADYLLQLTLPRKAEELLWKVKLTNLLTAPKAEYRRWIWPPVHWMHPAPQRRKNPPRRRQGRGRPHEELSSPELQILEAALAIGTDMEACRKSSKGPPRNFQLSKNAKFDLFDEVSWWRRGHDED